MTLRTPSRPPLSIGGDSDTIAAIAGSLAEACYPVPQDLEQRALAKLTPHLQGELTAITTYLDRFNL